MHSLIHVIEFACSPQGPRPSPRPVPGPGPGPGQGRGRGLGRGLGLGPRRSRGWGRDPGPLYRWSHSEPFSLKGRPAIRPSPTEPGRPRCNIVLVVMRPPRCVKTDSARPPRLPKRAAGRNQQLVCGCASTARGAIEVPLTKRRCGRRTSAFVSSAERQRQRQILVIPLHT